MSTKQIFGGAIFGLGGNRHTPYYTGLQVQTSALNIPIPIMWGRNRLTFNLIWWNDFRRHGHSAGKGGGKGGQTFTYSVAALMGLCWGELTSVPVVYTNQAKTTLAALGITLFGGTPTQTPFGYITTNHPAEALSYPNIAYLASSNLNLDSSPTLPSISMEVIGNLSGTMPGTDDVNPGDFVPDFLTNQLYGMTLDSSNIGTSVAFYKTYCQAEGLFMSPVLIAQDKATAIVDRWAALTNSWIFWSGSEIKFVPLGDRTITANGATYTPDNVVQYDIGPAELLGLDGPVKVTRKDPADAYNLTRIQIRNRALDYNSDVVEYKDQTLVDKYGLRDNSGFTADEITTTAVGLKVVTLIGKRAAYLVNEYSFSTSNRFVRLEPGDIVRLTDPTTPAITALPVRIKTVECDDGGVLSFTAEDFPGQVGTPIGQSLEPPAPTVFDTLVDPGDVNPPAIFEPASSLTGGPAQVWIAASGGQFWGGANVYISFDDVTYAQIDTITSPAKQGDLTAPLASHADPDTVNTLAVDLTESLQQLDAVTHADADAFRSLSYVVPQPVGPVVQPDGELLAYGTATATGTYTDDLTYLRRGLYGSVLGAHSSGDQFTLIDIAGTSGSLVKYALPSQYIGATVFVKFCSFNIYGLAIQDISAVTAYEYTPTGGGFGGGGSGLPTVPTGFGVTISGAQNSLSWNSNPATDNVTSYKLYRANGTGAGFGSATLIWQGLATAYLDTDIASGSGYTYFLSAVNAVGEGGHTAGVNATSSTFTYSLRVCGGTPGRKPDDGEVLFNIPMRAGDALPANLVGSLLEIDVANGGIAPTVDWDILLYKVVAGVGTLIFTGTIPAGTTVGSYGAGGAVSFGDGDFFSGVAISPQDATCEGASYTIIGTRTQ